MLIFTPGLLIEGDGLLFAAVDEQAEETVRLGHQNVRIERNASLVRGEATLFRIPLASING